MTSHPLAWLASHLPSNKSLGRPRTNTLWAILNAIFCTLCEGCIWQGLPGDFPPWQTVYIDFRRWKQKGTLLSIHDELYFPSRLVEGRGHSLSEMIIDSQSVKTATMIADAVGDDGAKKFKGSKRPLSIDTLGLVLRVLVTATDVPERTGDKRVRK